MGFAALLDYDLWLCVQHKPPQQAMSIESNKLENYGGTITMNDAKELAELDNLTYKTHEDYFAIELDANTKIAEQYGGLTSVHIGTIIARREVYKEPPTLYATIHYSDPTTGGFTPKQVEGYLKCSSIAELATVARSLSVGKTLVIDQSTLEILEVRTY